MDWRNVKKFVVGEPYDAEVEYLESNGTQTLSIPTRYPIPNVLDVQVTGGANQTIAAVGAANRTRKVWTNANGEYAVFGTSSGDASFGISGSLRKTIEISIPRTISVTIDATIDGVTKRGVVGRASSVGSINVFGTSALGFGTLRLYGVDHYKLVRVGQVGCLYDPETGNFIYPSTGTLACGPDVRVINRQEVVKISSGSTVLWKKPVPYDSEVEYLESTGTQYIDTGIRYFADFEVTIKLRESVANRALGISSSNCMQRASASNPVWRFTSDNTSYVTSVGITGKHTMTWKSNVISADGLVLTTKNKVFPAGQMLLFASATTAVYPNIIYGCKLYDSNGVLVRDFRPVRVGTTGYLFDRISWTLFGNAGTGSFGYGADVPSA